MKVSEVARAVGIAPTAVRFYERRGMLPRAARSRNGYRDYNDADVRRLRLLVGLRQLDLTLEQAAELSGLCAGGHCDEASAELRVVIGRKRSEVRGRMQRLAHLDEHLAHLEGGLAAGEPRRPLIMLGKEDRDDHPV